MDATLISGIAIGLSLMSISCAILGIRAANKNIKNLEEIIERNKRTIKSLSKHD